MSDRPEPSRDSENGNPRTDSLAERIVSGGSRSARRIAGVTGLDQAIEDAIVRAVESETTERALARIINGPVVTQAVEEALASKRAGDGQGGEAVSFEENAAHNPQKMGVRQTAADPLRPFRHAAKRKHETG